MPANKWSPPTDDELKLADHTGARRVSETQWTGGHCPSPNHEDEHPSFGFVRGKRHAIVTNCLGCDDTRGQRDAIAALGIRASDVAHRPVRHSPTRATPEFELPPPLDNQDLPLMWHDRLIQGRYPEQLEYLMTQRGLTLASIEERRIGYDEQRYTFPVRYAGKWRNVRRYLPGAKQKWVQLPGHGAALLYPTEVLAGNSLPVLLLEGELDSILAGQIGAGRFVAVTGTGGAGTPPKDLSPLAGRAVYVCYDLDDAGAKGAQKMLARLHDADIDAHLFDLRKLALPG
jgi:hypothetical protein